MEQITIMSKENIKINNFELFSEIVKSLSKMSDGAKFTVNDCGLTVYAKNDFSKCELTSNSIVSDKELSFCVGNLGMLLKIMTTLSGIYKEDVTNSVKLYFDHPFIRFESKKFKTKIATVEEANIANFIGNKVHTELSPQIEFTTNSGIIRSINSHSFVTTDSNTARIYVSTDSEMENNVIFATIGNEGNDLENSVTLELGLITSGVMDDRKVILNFDRLNILNMLPSEEINVQLAKERPVLISKVQKSGKNDTFFNISIYVFLMVK